MSNKSMKAFMYFGPEDIRLVDCPSPQISSTEVLIKITHALTCGTDYKTYLRGHPKLIKEIPSSFGYEFTGEIVELGSEVNRIRNTSDSNKICKNSNKSSDDESQVSTSKVKVKLASDDDKKFLANSSYAGNKTNNRADLNNVTLTVGDKVVCANTTPCYKCFYCKKGEFSLCENLEFLNGSYAEYIKIPANIVKHNLYKVHDNINPQAAAMAQSLAVVLHGFERSKIKDDDVVCVLGLGAIGQLFIKVIKKLTRAKVIALGRSASKLKQALSNGADLCLNTKGIETEQLQSELNNLCAILRDDTKKQFTQTDLSTEINSIIMNQDTENSFMDRLAKQVSEQECNYLADKVIEAVGKPETWQQALDLVRPGGLVNFFGGCKPGTKINLDTYQAHYQELKTVGVFHHTPKHMKWAVDLINARAFEVSDLISGTYALSELEDALKAGARGEIMKALIKI
jgi:L-iditol 2-dehydrogenase